MCICNWLWKWLIIHSQSSFPSYFRVSHAKGWFLVTMLLMGQHCRDGCTYSEGNSEVDPSQITSYASSFSHHWSFAFTHASTSSKCILFAIRYLSQLIWSPCPELAPWPRNHWIVSEMIDWLKVRDPALIKEVFCNSDSWEEPNSGSSTAGSADRQVGRCTQENWRGDSDSKAEEYWWRAATICRVGQCNPKVRDGVIYHLRHRRTAVVEILAKYIYFIWVPSIPPSRIIGVDTCRSAYLSKSHPLLSQSEHRALISDCILWYVEVL